MTNSWVMNVQNAGKSRLPGVELVQPPRGSHTDLYGPDYYQLQAGVNIVANSPNKTYNVRLEGTYVNEKNNKLNINLSIIGKGAEDYRLTKFASDLYPRPAEAMQTIDDSNYGQLHFLKKVSKKLTENFKKIATEEGQEMSGDATMYMLRSESPVTMQTQVDTPKGISVEEVNKLLVKALDLTVKEFDPNKRTQTDEMHTAMVRAIKESPGSGCSP